MRVFFFLKKLHNVCCLKEVKEIKGIQKILICPQF